MDNRTIRAAVIAALNTVQTSSGKPLPKVKDDTTPIGEVEAFDSLSGVEATILIEQQLGCTLAAGSAFVSPDGKKALTISGIVERVGKMIVHKGAA
jgi:acyl carrier protein